MNDSGTPQTSAKSAFKKKRGDPSRVGLVFDHPNEKPLREAILAELGKVTTGARMVETALDYAVEVRILKGTPIGQGFTTEGKTLYVTIPTRRVNPKPVDVLQAVGGLREVEQAIMGYVIPSLDSDPLDRAAMVHAKYLDTVVYMCRIASEMVEKFNNEQYIDAIEELGHSDIYKAYLAEQRGTALVDAYFQEAE